MKCRIFESRSTTTHIASIPSHSRSPTTKSIEIWSHGLFGTGKGQRTPKVACLELRDHCQSWEFRTYRSTCFRISFKYYSLSSRSNVLTHPASAKNISVWAEWLRQSGSAQSEPSETPRWPITQRPASIPHVALHIALRSPFRHFFSLCRSPIINKHAGVVANCDHTSEWVHWVHACIGIAMQWVTL